jgi:hypothetical protein
MSALTCIACGCTDDDPCVYDVEDTDVDEGGPCTCWWVRGDNDAGVGLCSECEQYEEAWDRGARSKTQLELLAPL